MSTQTDRDLTYGSIPGFTAPESLWRAAGGTVFSNTDEVGACGMRYDMPRLIAEGWHRHPGDGTAALLWALDEYRRQSEESARIRAQHADAAATAKLASAISASANQDALDRILPRLSERTQYAVRQQLRA